MSSVALARYGSFSGVGLGSKGGNEGPLTVVVLLLIHADKKNKQQFRRDFEEFT